MSAFKYSICEDSAYAIEKFSASDSKVLELTKSANQLTISQFKTLIQPGDVIITYVKKSLIPFSKLLSVSLTQFAQGSSFSSSKLVGNDAKEIIGYDAKPGGGLNVNVCSIDSFLRLHEVSLIFRCSKVTPENSRKILDFIYEKKNKKTPYAFGKVFISVFKHLFATDENLTTTTTTASDDISNQNVNVNNDIESKKRLTEDTRDREMSLFCSSIIHFAYKNAGIDIRYSTDITGDYVWPKDFIMSPDFKCVGGFFSKESGLRK